MEPFKSRQNRENQEQRENKEKGKHLALNTISGKCDGEPLKVNATSVEDKAMEQETAEAMATGTTVEKAKETEKPKVKCYSCGGFVHIERECTKKEESGLFVGMTIHGADIREDGPYSETVMGSPY